MTNAIITKGILQWMGGADYYKQITITFISDEILGIRPFVHPRYNTDAISGQDGFYDPTENHVKADGNYDSVIVQGSTWTDITALKNDLVSELKTKYQLVRDNNDLTSAPSTETEDLNT